MAEDGPAASAAHQSLGPGSAAAAAAAAGGSGGGHHHSKKKGTELQDVFDRAGGRKLLLRFVSATGLAAKDRNGKSDPFVTVELLGKKRFKTDVYKKTLQPTFAEKEWVFLDLTQAGARDGDELVLEMRDHDKIGKNEFMGEVRLRLGKLTPDEVEDKVCELKPRSASGKKKDVVSGTLHIRVYMTARTETRPLTPPDSMFFYKPLAHAFKPGDLILYDSHGFFPAVTKICSNSAYGSVGMILRLPNKWTEEEDLFVVEVSRNVDGLVDAFKDVPSTGVVIFRLFERLHHVHASRAWHVPIAKPLNAVEEEELNRYIGELHQASNSSDHTVLHKPFHSPEPVQVFMTLNDQLSEHNLVKRTHTTENFAGAIFSEGLRRARAIGLAAAAAAGSAPAEHAMKSGRHGHDAPLPAELLSNPKSEWALPEDAPGPALLRAYAENQDAHASGLRAQPVGGNLPFFCYPPPPAASLGPSAGGGGPAPTTSGPGPAGPSLSSQPSQRGPDEPAPLYSDQVGIRAAVADLRAGGGGGAAGGAASGAAGGAAGGAPPPLERKESKSKVMFSSQNYASATMGRGAPPPAYEASVPDGHQALGPPPPYDGPPPSYDGPPPGAAAPAAAAPGGGGGEQLTNLPAQAGGHEGALLREGNGRLRKRTSAAEAGFYEGLYQQVPAVQEFCPRFFGSFDVTDADAKGGTGAGGAQLGSEHGKWIVIEDATHGMQAPCVMDLKMGSSVSPEMDEAKADRARARDAKTTTGPLGFRLTGLSARTSKGEPVSFRKAADGSNNQATEAEVLPWIANFLGGDGGFRYPALAAFNAILAKIQAWASVQTEMQLRSSSLLFVYDEANPAHARIVMIDFAHTYPTPPGSPPDTEYARGVDNVLRIFNGFVPQQQGDTDPALQAAVAAVNAEGGAPADAGGPPPPF